MDARPENPTADNWHDMFSYRDGRLFWKMDPPRGPKMVGKPASRHWQGMYMRVGYRGREFKEHRIIYEMHYGAIPRGLGVDHIDGNGLNNDVSNLRLSTQTQNNANQKIRSNNTVGFKGVFKCRHTSLYVAQIRKHGKNKRLGSFETPESAHAAYCTAAVQLFGEYANFG